MLFLVGEVSLDLGGLELGDERPLRKGRRDREAGSSDKGKFSYEPAGGEKGENSGTAGTAG